MITRVAVLLCGATLCACSNVRTPALDTLALTDDRDCDVGVPPVLTDSGVGALRIGSSVEAVRASCMALDDRVVQQGGEGMPERRLTVVLGSVSTTSTVAGGRVWRIEIASPRFRTRDSLGVGTTLGTLRGRGASIMAGEDAAYALVEDHCGLSFQLPKGPGARNIADSVRVTLVLVTGCG